ncbi:MAG: DUF4405 domain-containing protein [Verrucomicrobia bacterium]|nr:DUF4405 domain-containing protein [Verrucomicrobiota bacterium]
MNTGNESSPRFQWRALVTSLVAFSFVLLLVSGVILFLAPPGRVANWTNWTIIGLRKGDWSGLHIWFSAVFLVVVGFHLFFNWRPLMSYLKDRLTRRVGFRPEWLAATALVAVVMIGTLKHVAPFEALLEWNESLKESWDRPAERAPIPHAELLTLSALAEKGGIDLATATTRLTAKGITGFTGDTVVQAIADAAKRSARELYDIIVTGPKGSAGHAEGKAGGGLGWKTLAQFCADEGIELAVAISRLKAGGVKADEKVTLRELATASGRKPYELPELIRGTPRP